MSDDIRNAVNKVLADALEKMELDGNYYPEPPFVSDPNKVLAVRKMVAYLPVSDEVLHPERYPAPKIPWRRRMWWRWSDYRQRLGAAWDVLRDRHDCGDY